MEYTHFETGEIISREQYIANGLTRGVLLVREECGCVVIQDRTADAYIVYCPKHKSAPELYEALKDIVDPDDCSLDHHGYCQAHGWLQSGLCPHFRAKRVLAKAEGK